MQLFVLKIHLLFFFFYIYGPDLFFDIMFFFISKVDFTFLSYEILRLYVQMSMKCTIHSKEIIDWFHKDDNKNIYNFN